MKRTVTLILTLAHFCRICSAQEQPKSVPSDGMQDKSWPKEFQLVEIPSPVDDVLQKAYWLPSSQDARPLLLSLHSWSGDYAQQDPLAEYARSHNWNYIHPDFRGQNWTKDACCSDLALADMDASISFALEHAKVDRDQIFVVGSSGGGYAALAMFMKSKHPIRKFSVWVPISDLIAWYDQSKARENKYAKNILDCTGSENGQLNISEARRRSPLFWLTPGERLDECKLHIYTGIFDGIQGSVPITQSINFYNKIVRDAYPNQLHKLVTNDEKLGLMEHRKPLRDYGEIGSRAICFQRSVGGLSLVIFDGNHEMLAEVAFESLTKN